jgi:hypothetical protein
MSDSFNKGRGLKSTFTGRAARNDITGALIKTGAVTPAYREGYDSIKWGVNKPQTGDTIPEGKRMVARV